MPDHVTGPHRRKDGPGFRIIVCRSGVRTFETFETESLASEAKRRIEEEFAREQQTTVGEVIELYREHLKQKGNKPKTFKETIRRLTRFFEVSVEDPGPAIRSLSEREGQKLYSKLVKSKTLAVDSHRNMLAEAKTFLRWCVESRYASENVLDKVKGIGKRRHGKPQLHGDEAKKWDATALEAAERLARTKRDKYGPIAAMMSLYMGLRAGEIVARRVRDLDEDGTVLWIEESKSEAGKRRVEVPEPVRSLLLGLAEGRAATDYLFPARYAKDGRYRTPHRDIPFVRKWVARICAEAKLPRVTAHSMRGLHATLATEQGITGSAVAAALGHESSSTTYQSYARPESVLKSVQARSLKILRGGK